MKDKKQFLIMVIILLLFAGFIYFYNYAMILDDGCNKCTLSGTCTLLACIDKNKTNTEIDEIRFNKEELTVIINSQDKDCNKDNDCIIFQPDCGDCTFTAINNNSLEKYEETKKEYCKVQSKIEMCDIVFSGIARCVNNQCKVLNN